MQTKWYHEAIGFGIFTFLLNGIILPYFFREELFYGNIFMSIIIAAAGGILYGVVTVWIREKYRKNKDKL